MPKKIIATENQVLLSTAIGILPGCITDQSGSTHEVGFSNLILSDLGHNVFSSSNAAARGISTIVEEEHPDLGKGSIVLPLTQLEEDGKLYLLK